MNRIIIALSEIILGGRVIVNLIERRLSLMNAGYYISTWILKLIKQQGNDGATNVVASYVGLTLATKLVSAVAAKASATKICAMVGAKLGSLAGPVGTVLVGLSSAL